MYPCVRRLAPWQKEGGKPECHSLQYHQHIAITHSTYTEPRTSTATAIFPGRCDVLVGLLFSTCRLLLLCVIAVRRIGRRIGRTCQPTALYCCCECVVCTALLPFCDPDNLVICIIRMAISGRLSVGPLRAHVLTASYFVAAMGDTYEQAPRVNVSPCQPTDDAKIPSTFVDVDTLCYCFRTCTRY